MNREISEPMERVWTFSTARSPFTATTAELVMQPDADWYPEVRRRAIDGGFTVAPMPMRCAPCVVLVRAGRFAELQFAGEFAVNAYTCEPPFPVTSEWMAAAMAQHAVHVVVMPPGTWKAQLPESGHVFDDPGPVDTYRRDLDRALIGGRSLWAIAKPVFE
ncbi:hypothetical protein ACFC1T_08875 [Kitasatospora sp. NPDC056076]|uniref:hypothetical protein n=1 Tax=Kitasatospora sp. NPDC056076 TaxID=3345703 RepID=UPI0035E3573A